MFKWLRRQWDKHDTGVFSSLYCSGNWRTVYPDDKKTVWLQYHQAKELAGIYGGYVMHRNQRETNHDNQ